MKTRPVAVITGASSGIGERFARELAKLGYNLILIARREALLENIKSEIISERNVHIEVISGDLSNTDRTKEMAEVLRKREDIEILINNAGFATAGTLADLPIEKPLNMVNLHVQASTILTHAVLKSMMANRKGYIINVSSMASFISSPFNVTYTGTKAFLNTFSKSLQKEVLKYGIYVQALCPGFTYSSFHDTEELRKIGRRGIPFWMWIKSEDVVRAALKNMKKKKVVVVPTVRYKIIRLIVSLRIFNILTRVAIQLRKKREQKKLASYRTND